MPFCPQCGAPIRPAFGAKCGNGHSYLGPDEEAVSISAKDMEEEFVRFFFAPERRYIPLTDAASLFLEAAHCCINRDFDACAVVCRAAIECVLFEARLMVPDEWRFLASPSIMNLLPYVQFNFGRLLRWAVEDKLLPKDLAKKADEVRTLGNYVAHLGEQKYREIAGMIRRGEIKSYRLWISPEEAYWALHVTKLVLLSVLENYPPRIS